MSRILAASVWIPVLALAAVQAPEPLTPVENRGKQIYRKGTSPSDTEITAAIGSTGVVVPASTMPCANCHGMDGQGRPEGGVNPSDIRWSALTKIYGVEHPGGRKHPPYTEADLLKAITMGVDPAGNALHVAMPKYRMSRGDMDDLIAYVKRLETDPDPGLTASTMRLATFLPEGGQWDEVGDAIQAALVAGLREINQAGGLYNRRIQLDVFRVPMSEDRRLVGFRELLETESHLALLAPFLAGAEDEMADLVETFAIPAIAPLTPRPRVAFPLDRHIFYLSPGVLDQLRALIAFAREEHPQAIASAAIVYSSAGGFEGPPDWRTPADYGRDENISSLSLDQYGAEALVTQLKGSSVEGLFLAISAGEALQLLRQADLASWRPRVFLPGSSLDDALFQAPASFDRRILSAAPSVPPAVGSPAAREYGRLAEKYSLPDHHISFQLNALAAVRLFAEGVTQAGRDLSRDKLIHALESLDAWDPVFSPRLTYGPNQRVGSLGVHIMTLDLSGKEYQPVRNWFVPRQGG